MACPCYFSQNVPVWDLMPNRAGPRRPLGGRTPEPAGQGPKAAPEPACGSAPATVSSPAWSPVTTSLPLTACPATGCPLVPTCQPLLIPERGRQAPPAHPPPRTRWPCRLSVGLLKSGGWHWGQPWAPGASCHTCRHQGDLAEGRLCAPSPPQGLGRSTGPEGHARGTACPVNPGRRLTWHRKLPGQLWTGGRARREAQGFAFRASGGRLRQPAARTSPLYPLALHLRTPHLPPLHP